MHSCHHDEQLSVCAPTRRLRQEIKDTHVVTVLNLAVNSNQISTAVINLYSRGRV